MLLEKCAFQESCYFADAWEQCREACDAVPACKGTMPAEPRPEWVAEKERRPRLNQTAALPAPVPSALDAPKACVPRGPCTAEYSGWCSAAQEHWVACGYPGTWSAECKCVGDDRPPCLERCEP